MEEFTIFPAIDLRDGKVVRLELGDPSRQTVFSDHPAEVAYQFLSAGAKWLHVINLDGAFGDERGARRNEMAIAQILEITPEFGGKIQVGGGIRSVKVIKRLLSMGVDRLILGTLAVEQPQIVIESVAQWGPERIAVSVDLRAGRIQTHGWQQSVDMKPSVWLQRLADEGLRWVVVTDVERDGILIGANPEITQSLPQDERLRVVLAGGVSRLEDIQIARRKGLAGVIIGRAFYSGELNLPEVLRMISNVG